MALCPRCKEDMPLLSKICPVCGYVEEGGDENNMSISEFVKLLEARLSEIKYIPEPSFMKGMGHFTYIIYPILAIALLLMFFISDSGLFMIGFLLFLILSIVALVRKSKGTLGYAPFNRWFKAVQNDFDYHKRIAKHSFGKSPEVSKLIDEISGEIAVIEKKRSSALKRNTIIWSVIVVVILGVSALGVKSVDSAVTNIEANAQADALNWSKLIEEYKAGNFESEEQARINIINAMLVGENNAEAEEFFITDCMGKMQDFDCAAMIVKHYNSKTEVESAKKFVDRCSGMRYSSDKNKLNSLITQ